MSKISKFTGIIVCEKLLQFWSARNCKKIYCLVLFALEKEGFYGVVPLKKKKQCKYQSAKKEFLTLFSVISLASNSCSLARFSSSIWMDFCITFAISHILSARSCNSWKIEKKCKFYSTQCQIQILWYGIKNLACLIIEKYFSLFSKVITLINDQKTI